MGYEVLYRKWRPQRFADVAGQQHVTTTLRNAVAAGRTSHAYLFAGPRGTGKTSTGRILAKAINCGAPQEGEPCNSCASCESYLAGRALDLVEMDAASNRGIEDIRELRERIGIAPGSSRYRVYLVDEVHQLTAAAFNALLKTLEEPPPHAVFVLATTEVHEVPATIASRCQRFDFRRISVEATVRRLQEVCLDEGFDADEEALVLIARQSTGSLRDAINLVDQVATQAGGRLSLETAQRIMGLSGDARTRQLARTLIEGDLPGAFALLSRVRDDGVDLRRFHRELVGYLRNLLVLRSGAGDGLDLPADDRRAMQDLVAGVAPEELLRMVKGVSAADFRGDPQSSLPLELAIAGIILPPQEAPREPARELRTPRESPAVTRSPAAPGGSVSRERPPAPRPAPPPRPVVAERPDTGEAGDTALPRAPQPAGIQPDFLKQLYQAARPANPRAAAFVNGSCEVVSWEAPNLTLGIFESHKFLLEKVMSAEVRQVIETAAAEILGSPVELACVIIERKPRETGGNSGGNALRGGHLIEAARQMGAQPIGDIQ